VAFWATVLVVVLLSWCAGKIGDRADIAIARCSGITRALPAGTNPNEGKRTSRGAQRRRVSLAASCRYDGDRGGGLQVPGLFKPQHSMSRCFLGAGAFWWQTAAVFCDR
jgi:hypothetical protein